MKIIFWDYDGTLVDTELLYKKSIEEYFQKNNHLLKNIPDEYFFEYMSGKHPKDFISKLSLDGFIKNCENINCEKIKEYYTGYFKNLKQGEITIVKGTNYALDKLSKLKNTIMCITSSSFIHDYQIKHDNVNDEILNKNFVLGKNVYLCGDIENCSFKPAPDIFFYALNDITKKYKLNLTINDELFVVEDSIAGCHAGLFFKENMNNKIKVKLIYLNTNSRKNNVDLLKNGVDFIVNNANDIYSILST